MGRTQRGRPLARLNWAFVPLVAFILIRSIVEGRWLYGLLVVVGLGLGLWLRHKGHE